jgi:peptidyl-prolyl cis-trans isomerase B (cyclophilin B)
MRSRLISHARIVGIALWWSMFALPGAMPAALAQTTWQDEQARAEVELARPALAPDRLYNRPGAPLIMVTPGPASLGFTRLVLLDALGEIVVGPVEVRRGRIDLGLVMPEVWELREPAYLQRLDLEDRPVGAAVVLQPMLSRRVPVNEIARRPDGSTFTRITGWKDEMLLAPEDLVPTRATADDPARARLRDEDDVITIANVDDAYEPVFSGLRAYVETHVVLWTTLGRIELALAADQAPNTAWNFLQLTADGFYDDLTFHRVVKYNRSGDPFVIQGGDPTGLGDGGPGYWVPFEPSHLPHDFGVLSMARADHPDSAGSQFFICLSREGTQHLDGQYCSFGYAVAGTDAVLAIADAELDDVASGRPLIPPRIVSGFRVPAWPHQPGENPLDRRITPEIQPVHDVPEPDRVPR